MGQALKLTCPESSQHAASLQVGSTLETLCPPESLVQLDRKGNLDLLEAELPRERLDGSGPGSHESACFSTEGRGGQRGGGKDSQMDDSLAQRCDTLHPPVWGALQIVSKVSRFVQLLQVHLGQVG